MVHVDVEVVGKKEMCWSYGQAGGNLANQSNGRGEAEGKYSYGDDRGEF